MLTKDGGDDPSFNVFTRRQDANRLKIRHFWGGEMNGASKGAAPIGIRS
jgi:hypothetical protein